MAFYLLMAGSCCHSFTFVLSCATETYRIVFRMKDFGSATKKPTMLLANSRVVCRRFHTPPSACPRFLKGVAKRRMKVKSLCRRYTDSPGQARFVGTPLLKGSQNLDFNIYFVSCAPRVTCKGKWKAKCQSRSKSIWIGKSVEKPVFLNLMHLSFQKIVA